MCLSCMCKLSKLCVQLYQVATVTCNLGKLQLQFHTFSNIVQVRTALTHWPLTDTQPTTKTTRQRVWIMRSDVRVDMLCACCIHTFTCHLSYAYTYMYMYMLYGILYLVCVLLLATGYWLLAIGTWHVSYQFGTNMPLCWYTVQNAQHLIMWTCICCTYCRREHVNIDHCV
jgi:hypothetical protein